MKRFIYILIAVNTFFIGILFTQNFNKADTGMVNIPDQQSESEVLPETNYPRFRVISATSFQSSDGERRFADDCIGCNEEVGDIGIYHNSESPEQTSYTLESELRRTSRGNC